MSYFYYEFIYIYTHTQKANRFVAPNTMRKEKDPFRLYTFLPNDTEECMVFCDN